MSDLPTVTIIVLNYNGLRHLEGCFTSLMKIDYPAERLELMLMDNASTDGSVDYVETHYPGVRVVRSEQNLGFSGGNNLGARHATTQYVVFLNNDVRVHPHFVRGLVDAVLSGPDVVCAGAKILNWDGTRFDYAGSAAHFAGYGRQTGRHRLFVEDRFTEVTPTLFACGGAMIVDRQVFLDVGGFDEDYFLFYEDLDFGWRLWVMGYKVVFAPDAVVNHRHHGTVDNFSNHQKQVLFKRNALYSVMKNYSDENLTRVLPAVLLGTVDGVVGLALRRRQLNLDDFDIKQKRRSRRATLRIDKRNMSTLIAVHEVVEHLSQVMGKRRFVQQNRRRADEEVAQLFRWPFQPWPDVGDDTQQIVADVFGLHDLFGNITRRVLIISSDTLPYPGMHTVGSGLRSWGLGQALESRGHEVIFSMPKAALVGCEEIAPPEAVELAWEPDIMHEVVKTVEPDIVVVCNWPLLDLLDAERADVPLILDQAGPHYLEREFQGFGDPADNSRRKINALGKADFFTCCGEKQFAYFQSWLEQAGWTEEDRQERTGVIPFSVAPDLPERHPGDELTFVYGGTFLPWQDPSIGLSLLVEEMEHREQGKLLFFGGRHTVYPVDPGVYEDLAQELERSPRVVISGIVPFADLIAQYARAHVALDLMKRNAERELAFTTRTVVYLWCGLPVIYNDYSELSDYIRDYNAGWIVDPEDRDAIRAVLNGIFEHPEQVRERSRNAQRLVQERLNWDLTIDPLHRFVCCADLRKSAHRSPYKGLRHLWGRAKIHYRQGGLKMVINEVEPYLRWQLKRFWNS